MVKKRKKSTKQSKLKTRTGLAEVKGEKLYYKGKEVLKGRTFEYEFPDGDFAMTKTFFLYLKRKMPKFKIKKRTLKTRWSIK